VSQLVRAQHREEGASGRGWRLGGGGQYGRRSSTSGQCPPPAPPYPSIPSSPSPAPSKQRRSHNNQRQRHNNLDNVTTSRANVTTTRGHGHNRQEPGNRRMASGAADGSRNLLTPGPHGTPQRHGTPRGGPDRNPMSKPKGSASQEFQGTPQGHGTPRGGPKGGPRFEPKGSAFVSSRAPSSAEKWGATARSSSWGTLYRSSLRMHSVNNMLRHIPKPALWAAPRKILPECHDWLGPSARPTLSYCRYVYGSQYVYNYGLCTGTVSVWLCLLVQLTSPYNTVCITCLAPCVQLSLCCHNTCNHRCHSLCHCVRHCLCAAGISGSGRGRAQACAQYLPPYTDSTVCVTVTLCVTVRAAVCVLQGHSVPAKGVPRHAGCLHKAAQSVSL